MLRGYPSGKALVSRASKREWGEDSALRCTDTMTLSLPWGPKICIAQHVLAQAEVR